MTARKFDKVAELLRARINAGDLRPGMVAPSSTELAREHGYAVLTCRKALDLLFAEGELTRVSKNGRFRVAGDDQAGDGREPAQALAGRRRAAGLTQAELAVLVGKSVTTVAHAETGRLRQSRAFWESADLALNAGGDLVARYDAWKAKRARDAAEVLEQALQVSGTAGALAAPAGTAGAAELRGIVITVPCGPVPVTVRWGDGSVTTVQPDPARADRGVG